MKYKAITFFFLVLLTTSCSLSINAPTKLPETVVTPSVNKDQVDVEKSVSIDRDIVGLWLAPDFLVSSYEFIDFLPDGRILTPHIDGDYDWGFGKYEILSKNSIAIEPDNSENNTSLLLSILSFSGDNLEVKYSDSDEIIKLTRIPPVEDLSAKLVSYWDFKATSFSDTNLTSDGALIFGSNNELTFISKNGLYIAQTYQIWSANTIAILDKEWPAPYIFWATSMKGDELFLQDAVEGDTISARKSNYKFSVEEIIGMWVDISDDKVLEFTENKVIWHSDGFIVPYIVISDNVIKLGEPDGYIFYWLIDYSNGVINYTTISPTQDGIMKIQSTLNRYNQ